ncbi:MAG TPA: enoyl-CoA hydratase-related protein [Rhizomicrobium sp.]
MADPGFTLDVANAIAHLRFSRGEDHNTMLPEFWREFPAALRALDDGAQARVLVISSSGRHFSGGMDLSVFENAIPLGKEQGRTRARLRQTILDLQDCFSLLERVRMPVLAAMQGGCIGAGLDMACACDCRYATQDAFFVIQEINLGLTADLGTFPRLCRLMPEGMVRQMAYTGERLSAARARELGLVNDIFPDQDAMLIHVMALAKEIAEKSPLAVQGSKAMINYARDHSIVDTLDFAATWQAGMFHPENDMAEALRAKREKRAALFADLLPAKKGL